MTDLTVVEKGQAVATLPPSDNGNEMAMMILRAANSPDFDVAKLEKLMDLQERETNRQAKVAFNKAFAEMQSQIDTVTKSKTVSYGQNADKSPKTAYKHATLEDIVDVVRPTLERFGFAVTFSVDTKQGVIVNCTLLHKLGHSIDTTITLNPDTSGNKNAVQAVGSAISYGKRYTLCSLLNIATRDDDDAQSCSLNAGKSITTFQVEGLLNKINLLNTDRQAGFYAYLNKDFGISKIDELPAKQYNTVLAFLNKAVGANNANS